MDKYVKIWLRILNDEHWVGMHCTLRGYWLQLFLIAKAHGDTGVIRVRNGAHMGCLTGCDGETSRNFLVLLEKKKRIKVRKMDGGGLEITIPKYRYYQDLTTGIIVEKSAKSPRKVQEVKGGEPLLNDLTQHNTTQPDLTQPNTTAETKVSGRSECQLFIDWYREQFEQIRGAKFMPTWVRDVKMVKEMLKVFGEDQLKERAQRYLTCEDEFTVKQGHNIAEFKRTINAYGNSTTPRHGKEAMATARSLESWNARKNNEKP